jgi:hypothetical protein
MNQETLEKIKRLHWLRVFINDGIISTNVKRIKWDSETEELVIQFQNNAYYTYFNVPEGIFNRVEDGLAGTKTSGPWGPVGKFPSVGAAVHQYLIEGGFSYRRGGRI